MRRFVARHWPIAILAAVWILFTHRYLLGWVMYPDGDFTQQFYVFRNIAYRALASGNLPLWSDCFFAGYPFHADPQSQLFYPPLWIVFAALKLLGYGHFPIYALTLEAVIHYFLTSIFTFLFVRTEFDPSTSADKAENRQDMGGVFAALLGSVTFTYGGYLTGYPPLQTGILETVTWLPLILLTLRRLAAPQPTIHSTQYISRIMYLVSRLNLKQASLCALLLSITFFAGHPQSFLFVFYLSAAYYFHRIWVSKASWRWAIARLAVVLVLAGGLISVQLLPLAQFLMLSTRASLSFEELSKGFPIGIVTQFFFTDSIWSPLYVGILPLALSVFAIAASITARESVRQKSGIWFWFGAGLVAVLLSFGRETPLYTVAYWLLPGYRLFRGQERLAMIVSFSLAVLASYSLAFLFQALSRSLKIAVGVAGAIILLVGIVALAVAYNPALTDWLPRAGLMIGGLACVVLILLARSIPFFERNKPIWGMATVALTVVNLFVGLTHANAVPPFDPYPYNPILDPLRTESESFFRVQADFPTMQGHFGCGYGFKEWGGISPIRLASWATFEDRVPESLRWKLMAIRYLITWKNGAITREGELPPAERAAEGDAPLGPAKVYRLFEIPRRAWLVYNYQTIADQADKFDQIGAPGFDPFSQAVLHASSPADAALFADDNGIEHFVDVKGDQPGHIVIQVNSRRPAMLIVSEAYYPGWAVTINGKPAPIYEADGYVLSTLVPAGDSTIELNYRPTTLIVGAALSLSSLLASLALFAVKLPPVSLNTSRTTS